MPDTTPRNFTINQQRYEFPAKAGQTLLDLLRDELGITGPKLGCGEGACGACTVLVGSRAIQSCQVDADSVSAERITTVEGLAEDGILHPVQQAWLEAGAMQCGYCTPGWLIGTAALLARVSHPDDQRIDAELAGHVCRCCTYPRIRRAIHRAAELMDDPELLEPVPPHALRQLVVTEPVLASAPPLDTERQRPEAFAAAMPEGMMAIVAPDSNAEGWGGPDDAWVHVGADSRVTAFTGKVEAGQGTRTALALLVAEELAVPPGWVSLAMADTDSSPFDLGTFGSRSMPHAAPPLRAAAAGARRLLLEQASARFGIPQAALTTADGMIAGPDGAPVVSYGDLVAGQRRAELVPADGPVKPAAQWRIAGRPARAGNAADVVTGTKVFPSDLRMDGMLHGSVLHPPVTGATLRSADTAAAAAIPGVTVVEVAGRIGVVAEDRTAARAALAAITADWDDHAGPELAGVGPAELDSHLRAHPVSGEGWSAPFAHEQGDPHKALAAGPVRLEATYTAAYVAHVPLEPRAALASWRGDQLTVWTATSTPFRARRELAAELNIDEVSIQVIVPDFGGGFGGKHGSAVALEAALLARATERPVKVQWSRNDEFSSGYLRPAAVIDVASSADAAGSLTGWSFTNINSGGAGLTTPYRVPSQQIAYVPAEAPLLQGSYRALAATANNFARESHMDELAVAIGADPVEFRLSHLDDDRLADVLRAAVARMGDDGQTHHDGQQGTGFALGIEKSARVATAARVLVGPDGTLRLLRLVTAVDCGAIVHPDGLLNQVEGAIVMGLGPALFEQIDFSGGRILNGSMTSYRVPQLADVPAELEVVLVDRPEELPVGGGETPIIAVAPAIANAIYAACGIRLRSMPLTPSGRVPGLR